MVVTLHGQGTLQMIQASWFLDEIPEITHCPSVSGMVSVKAVILIYGFSYIKYMHYDANGHYTNLQDNLIIYFSIILR